jgi:hypothetical protein
MREVGARVAERRRDADEDDLGADERVAVRRERDGARGHAGPEQRLVDPRHGQAAVPQIGDASGVGVDPHDREPRVTGGAGERDTDVALSDDRDASPPVEDATPERRRRLHASTS